MAYILSSLPDVCSENHIKISRVPVIRELMGSKPYEFDVVPFPPDSKQRKKIGTKNATRSSNREKEVLQHRNKTFLMPTVNSIAKDFFVGSLLEAVTELEELDDSTTINLPQYKAHYTDPLKITWGPAFPNQKAFTSANVDGVLYKVSSCCPDFLMILMIFYIDWRCCYGCPRYTEQCCSKGITDCQ